MKRTFLVEIESNGHPALWNDEAIQYRIMMSPSDSVFVTDITATHAKDREVIEAALEFELFSTDGIPDVSAVERRWSNLVGKVRELRAMMKKKATDDSLTLVKPKPKKPRKKKGEA